MPNPYFQFKQFVVFHDKCAMKVGTDGVLVGAWAQVDGARRVLDIGTGSGLIALMLAQRNPDAFVTAVDIDEAAVEQARENVARTPWSDRMEVERLDIRKAPEEWNGCFDAIVSNPPYFVESVKCPQAQRNTARHTDELDFDALLSKVSVLLSEKVVFVVLPATAFGRFCGFSPRERFASFAADLGASTPGIARQACADGVREASLCADGNHAPSHRDGASCLYTGV